MKKYCFAALLVLVIILAGCSGPDTEGKTFKILYYANGAKGNVPVDNHPYISGENAVVRDENTLYKDGYKFQYWNTKPEGDGITYKVGDTITVKNYSIFLHAIWVKLP
jgi:hypothetical protein